jgi:uncharacterized protein (TIGR02596 family)
MTQSFFSQTRLFQLQRKAARAGFTLVELVIVISIVVALAALSTPSLVEVMRATRLTSAGDNLQNRLSLAQQAALSKSVDVEMRFYKYLDEDAAVNDQEAFHAYQVVEVPQNGDQPRSLSEIFYVESGIVIDQREERSPLLDTTLTQQKPRNAKAFLFEPRGGISPETVKYSAIRFSANGECRFLTEPSIEATAQNNADEASAMAYTVKPLDLSCLTLVQASDLRKTELAKNFYCLQIDCYSGKTRAFRP